MSHNNIHVLSRGILIDHEFILLCKTTDLVKNFYFLPGGHVEHSESVYDTIVREIKEEAGCECSIKKFLGCLEYSFEPAGNSICHNHEYNFIFEIASTELSFQKKIPRLETHIELVWEPLEILSQIDFRPEPLKTLIPQWLSQTQSHNFSSMMI